ncbi:hypothetical protein Mal48_14830 [Thalassoglobus polymorphus]|uniref:Transposase n=1 Tax=Thalassoglobus polymorphus TaxID=2527994 RepID=A0A517QKR9_9PLAN|nr:hypothetical protein Mal48_14830 [Thalassoglobus polymorphus]
MSQTKRSSGSNRPPRRSFTEEFKRDAVSLVTDQGDSLAEAVRSTVCP